GPLVVAPHNFLDWRASYEPVLSVVDVGRLGVWLAFMVFLRAHPELLRVRCPNGNTLLSLASSLAACPPDAKGTPDASASGDNGAPGQHRLAVVQLLLAAGADVRQGNDRGWTPLHQAAYRNDPELSALLLSAGAPI